MKLKFLLVLCTGLFLLGRLLAEPSDDSVNQQIAITTALTPEEEEKAELAKMPTRAELCQVLNDGFAARFNPDNPSYLENAHKIIEGYPDTAIRSFLPAEHLTRSATTFKYITLNVPLWLAQHQSILNENGYVSPDIPQQSVSHIGVGVGVRSDQASEGAYYVFETNNHKHCDELYYLKFYDDRTVWDQVIDFMQACNQDGKVDPEWWVDAEGRFYQKIIYHYASDEDLNAFLAYWGLELSQENDPSLGLPSGMVKHVALIDPSSGEERQKWTMLIPLTEKNVGAQGFFNRDLIYKSSYYVIPLQRVASKVNDTRWF